MTFSKVNIAVNKTKSCHQGSTNKQTNFNEDTCILQTHTRTEYSTVMPNTHRRRDATVELSRVGVGGVFWA